MRKKATHAGALRRGGPSAESIAEIPEVDFSRGIQPHRYARLRSGYANHVFIDAEVFAHFGSAEEINRALRLLIDVAKREEPARAGRSGRVSGAKRVAKTRSRRAA